MRNDRASLKLIYFAMLASTLIYAVIVWVMFGARVPAMTMEQSLRQQPPVLLMTVMSLVMFVVQFMAGGATREKIIRRWALVESSSIFGMIATFLSGDWHFFAIGWTLSLLGFALSFPSTQEA